MNTSEGPTRQSTCNGNPPEALANLAQDTLTYLEEASTLAAGDLAQEHEPTADVFASVNTMTGAALRNLSGIADEKRRNLEAVIAEPAIARIQVLNDAGQRETIYITPAGALRPSWGNARVAS